MYLKINILPLDIFDYLIINNAYRRVSSILIKYLGMPKIVDNYVLERKIGSG